MSLRIRQPSPKSGSLTTLKSEALRLRGGADGAKDPDDPFAEMYGEKEDSEALEARLAKEAEDWSVSEEDENGNVRGCGQQHILELRGGVDEMPGGKVAVYQYLVIGGGNAGGYVMKGLMTEGAPKAHICLISAEKSLPYERPALSKGYLLGKLPSPEDGGFNCVSEDAYREHEVALRLHTRVTRVDLERKLVFTESVRFGELVSDIVGYRSLCIATGSSAIKLTCPGHDLKNVFYIRDADDVDALRAVATAGKKAVVIGGGYIGLEVSACLAILGLDVTLVARTGHLLPKLFTPELSKFFEDLWTAKGVKILKHTEVTSLSGDTAVSSLALSPSSSSSSSSPPPSTLPCDLVVAGLGAVPNTKLFQGKEGGELGGSGHTLELDPTTKAIVVDAHLRTRLEDVFAIGDVVSFPVEGLGGGRRVEGHVTHARASGLYTARSMLGKSGHTEPYAYLPLLYSRVDPWGLCWKFFGHNDGQLRLIGKVKSGDFSGFWLNGDEIRGGIHCTLKGESTAKEAFEILREVVEGGVALDETARSLFDECTSIQQVAEVLLNRKMHEA